MQLAASSSTTVSATERPNLDGVSMSCLGRSPTRHTNTQLTCTWKFSFSTFSPIEVCFGRSVVLFPTKKGLPHAVARLAKLIVFVFPVSVTACRGLAISCATQNLKTSVFRWVSSTSPGALCRISSSVAGLIPGERTSATPRSVLQISDRHLGRYPIHITLAHYHVRKHSFF